MKCCKCGSELPDNALFCDVCGERVGETIPVDNPTSSVLLKQSRMPVSKIIALIVQIIGVCNGILSFVFGIICFHHHTGNFVSAGSYGGDAYTGIQNAAASTASNVSILTDLVRDAFGAILIVLGLALVCFFITRILDLFSKKT